jgi:hypothetical protein
MPVVLRRVLLLVPPLLLAGLEILHPQPDESARALMDVSTWFAGFQVIQLALIGLVALSVLLLCRLVLLGGLAFPFGTLALGCFFVGALLHELRAPPRHFSSA